MKVKLLKKLLSACDDDMDVIDPVGRKLTSYGKNEAGTGIILVPVPKDHILNKYI